uniref:RRM domain-containing protein n=1 Tax=Angiostrongylus cantonensis TaxID=6313 RepID=A0A0K0D2X7_ANGCA
MSPTTSETVKEEIRDEERDEDEEDEDEDEKDRSTTDESQDTNDSKQKMPQTTYVRLRGLPYSAKESDIRAFLDGIPVTTITMSSSHNGRPSGECYCELPSKQDTLKALEFHRKEMEGRYIEIFTVSIDELTNLKRVGLVTDDGKVIRLRGLPFSATLQDVKDFFKGLNCEEVVFGRTGGRPSGEAFVRLATREEAAKALDFNKEHMGSRYVEVFRTTVDDMERNRPRSYESGGYIRSLFDTKAYDFLDYVLFVIFAYITFVIQVFMRGLPFDADAYMIEQFFAPLRCVEIRFNDERRPSGDAMVEFGTTAEAHEAFSRNKAMMGKRYVELFGWNDMPNTMRRLTWRVVGGQPAPRPLALVAPRGNHRCFGIGCHPIYGSIHGGYGRGYEPVIPGPFRSYSSGGSYGGGSGRVRSRRHWRK